MSQNVCIVPNCTTIRQRAFFKFPVEDELMLILWKQKMPFLETLDINYENSSICEDHFAEDQIFRKGTKKKKLLRAGAIPTIFEEVDTKPEIPPKTLTKAARKQVQKENEEEEDKKFIDENSDFEEGQGGEKEDPGDGSKDSDRSNCRFCMKPINYGSEVDITENIKRYFREVTNTEFVDHLGYSDLSCRHCYSDLKKSMSVKKKFIKNQEKLLNLLGVPETRENEPEYEDQKPQIPSIVRIKQEQGVMDVYNPYAEYSYEDAAADLDTPSNFKMFIPEIRHTNERRKDFQCDFCGKKVLYLTI